MQTMFKKIEKQYIFYVIFYWCSFTLSRIGLYYLSGAMLIVCAFWMYISWYRVNDNPVDFRGLYTLAWVGGQGVACLQLSNIQDDWSLYTWVCFFFAYIFFSIGYNIKGGKFNNGEISEINKSTEQAKRILICISILMFLSIVCFIIEAFIVGFIPIFSKMPHAYSYFHVSGVHYFTISCILIPALSVLYLKVEEKISKLKRGLLLFSNCIAVIIPILCVSRFQLLFAIGFATIIYILVFKRLKLKTLILIVACLVPVYALLTVARNHNIDYLNGIFDMKYDKMPIFITQPYIYIANNFENFNRLVEQISGHSWGLRGLFPVFALTGLKFVFPQLTNFEIFLTKPELNTLTMFYDAFYDFGLWGIILLAISLGYISKITLNKIKAPVNPIVFLFYGQMAIYLGLAFFTTWFSNPTTWFWLILTGMMYFYVGYTKKEKRLENHE